MDTVIQLWIFIISFKSEMNNLFCRRSFHCFLPFFPSFIFVVVVIVLCWLVLSWVCYFTSLSSTLFSRDVMNPIVISAHRKHTCEWFLADLCVLFMNFPVFLFKIYIPVSQSAWNWDPSSASVILFKSCYNL